jgi:hypothetical protein
VSIWHTQEIHDVATAALRLHAAARTATAALVEVSIVGFGTSAALLLRKTEGEWTIDRLYTADHVLPGAVAVVVVGVWRADAALASHI